ncbi:MAG: aspartate--tRNA ligase [Flavobacteriaceae bacterium TMED120]|nr:MAG: aspartate--tRNA ligase [Flavobacteriaceae bacterium TMED120]CAI8231365.1 MAG: Aspartate--tRNA ligase [Flavobacteriaceae bacterium]HCQ23926.1 aspartate--tRNA ligase [Flavobacteriaceae bacterium]|tara:strand:- start:604 stop:2364 length:1761 start_codon:yes stop_codon:yes gene_type:complete
MLRTTNCGALRLSEVGQKVTLSGWVQKTRNKGFMLWVDLRDRYGITQIIFDEERSPRRVFKEAQQLGREYVIQIEGEVIERESKNPNMKTGGIEILANRLTLLNPSSTPPFTIEDDTDGGEELRMQYRYLDLRRTPVQDSLIFRHRVALAVRNYLSGEGFIEIETPYLIKSTPEGARDFVVPSRMHKGEFYALPQSPQTFKQLLMVGGMDKYFQIVKCFRDEDLRSDRQPEFTQIDCELAFVEQEDILNQFEGLTQHLIQSLLGEDVGVFPRMTYDEAIRRYGNDKPDIRFGMEFTELNSMAQGKGFGVFDSQELVVGIAVPEAAEYTRKQIDALIDWVKRPQIGALGLVWVKCNADGSFKSSVDKFFSTEDLKAWASETSAQAGDLILVMAGEAQSTRRQLSALRMELAERLGLRDPKVFAPLWITDFPLLEWDEESQRFHAMHHPFTAPKPEEADLLATDPKKVKANAYDLVLNGNEIGGGSIRIHNAELQQKMFDLLGFSPEEAQAQFGFLMDAFQYGAPPHGGIAFGLDRLVAILAGKETIRDYIAFPKNNSGRDLMIDAPTAIDPLQLDELGLNIQPNSSE